MAVHKHPTGGYRAYKKINHIPHVFYSHDPQEAAVKQAEFDAKAALNPRKLLKKTGRLIGFTLRITRRKNRTPKINVHQHLQHKNELVRIQIVYTSPVVMWQQILTRFITFHNLSEDTLQTLNHKILRAKALYFADLYRLLDELSEQGDIFCQQ